MDRVDRLIISLLQENARTSLSEISSKVSLSVSAVSERIRKLESSGLIKCYTAILDPHAFKRDFCVLLFVKLTGPAFPQAPARRSSSVTHWPAPMTLASKC